MYVSVHLHIRPFFYGEHLGRYGCAKTFGRLWPRLLYIQVTPVLMLRQTIGPEYIYFLFCSSNNSVRKTFFILEEKKLLFAKLVQQTEVGENTWLKIVLTQALLISLLVVNKVGVIKH